MIFQTGNEFVDALEVGTRGQPVLLDQLALNRDEATSRERLAGYANDLTNARRGEDQLLASANAIHPCRTAGR